jgi:hypothetical protein
MLPAGIEKMFNTAAVHMISGFMIASPLVRIALGIWVLMIVRWWPNLASRPRHRPLVRQPPHKHAEIQRIKTALLRAALLEAKLLLGGVVLDLTLVLSK